MDSLFFDLDGTLIDSKLDLANSVNATLDHFKLKTLDNNIIYKFVGNGVKQLLVDCLIHNNRMDIFDEFYVYFLEHYHRHLLDNTVVYDGIFHVLNELSGEYTMFIVTNKSEVFARKIVEKLGLSKYFKDVVGGDTYKNKKPHPEPILKLQKKYALNIKNSIVIGDSENDILMAKALDLKIAWVSYGFRDKDILKKYAIDYIINTPEEILDNIEH